MSDPPLLALEHATKTFELRSLFGPSKRVEALRDVSLTLGEGRALAIVGESGSGKSTLGRAVTGLCARTHASCVSICRRWFTSHDTDWRRHNGRPTNRGYRRATSLQNY